MGCGGSKAAADHEKLLSKSLSAKNDRTAANDLNTKGGHSYNLNKSDMEGVLTLHLGRTSELVINTNAKKVYLTATFGAQTFRSNQVALGPTCQWDDVCHIWIQAHQLEAKVSTSLSLIAQQVSPGAVATPHVLTLSECIHPQVLVCVYADDSTIGTDTLMGSNYVPVASLMATAVKEERQDKEISCKLFPEAVFRGETFADVRSRQHPPPLTRASLLRRDANPRSPDLLMRMGARARLRRCRSRRWATSRCRPRTARARRS
jgi:hypothetical protein